ncbi:hypothetical protein [uncultured Bacteroides sp.]|uniref:hypothetical protein n=1 Tax=uncultured Bacteroides sp. TaxID=162156 RepID=UPI002AAB4411|nr:hypothetical protein [uncultured Bacteroides sp.]
MRSCVLIFFLLLLPVKSLAQKSPESVVTDFYNWYFEVIESGQIEEYQPIFVADSTGMATLNMDKYIKNLRFYNFTDSLINHEINSYQNCIKEVSKTKFDDLNDKFPNLDDYKNIGCDFFNIYRWLMDVEPMNGVEIIETIKVNENKIIVKGRFFRGSDITKDKSYWNKNLYVSLNKENSIWKIDQIEIKKTNLK